jgi:hypothetical protein
MLRLVMKLARTVTPKCFFIAWISGWVIAIYVPSVLIALAGLSPLAAGKGLLSGAFAVADEVAPAAKLCFAALMAIFMLIARRLVADRNLLTVILDMSLALSAMILVIALLPQDWSRGFGIGLANTRFAVLPTAIYAFGAILSGLAFSLSEANCSAQRSGLAG